jgi:rhodanese-related sulfurtransferase
VPLAGPANRQGRIAADHANGRPSRYRGTQGTSILRVFEMTLALTGASEKSLVRAGTPFRKIYLHPSHHAGYYPGAEGMTIKLLFSPDTGRVLGAQASGRSGVDKRIDVLSIAIQAGMTVFDLEEAELAYAPQYGSAKDPINMAGFIAAGLLRGDHPQVAPDQMASQPPETLIVDVRTPSEHAQGKIPGSVNIPIDELRDRLDEIPRDRRVVVHCQVGMRGYLATRILLQAGRVTANLSGGYQSYRQFFPS